eukprot:GILJ01005117.1.p1 GENE.GILJ01005117.1~~GILJ01005117.1.p1  ORF type:complete len:131 (+),score=12.44 GILJ01005117.1:49-441(+)
MKSGEVWGMLIVGLFWGATTPFLEQGSEGVEKVQARGFFNKAVAELRYILTRWRFVVPFLINQSASLVFYYLLGQAEISVAVPICNCVAFVITSMVEAYLHGRRPNMYTILGTALVLLGLFVSLRAATLK